MQRHPGVANDGVKARMVTVPVGCASVTHTAQRQEYGIENAQTPLLERAVVEGDGRMPAGLLRFLPFLLVSR